MASYRHAEDGTMAVNTANIPQAKTSAPERTPDYVDKLRLSW
jgi:hypothetical protein